MAPTARRRGGVDVPARTAVVTGASSGIGRACAILLRERGFHVFAGVRSDPDAAAAEDLGLTPLWMDVTDAGAIAAAAARVAAGTGGPGLYALVNNAGVVVPGPLEHLSPALLREQLEVNLVGQLATIQGFLPLLRAARGRIVNVSSVSGRIASPFIGAYTMAKHGLEALSDTLRMELRPWGIEVCVVQPGAVATPMPEKLLHEVARVGAALPGPAREHYGPTFLRYGRALADNNIHSGDSPERVARAVLAAVTDARPRTRYVVGARTGFLLVVSRLLPDRLRDRVTLRFLERYRPRG